MEYNEGDLVLCTVDKVSNTVTSVFLADGMKGTIVSSEIASGRIKFMRAYVVPNKKIVCKILSVRGESLNLSLRRVSAKEKNEVIKEYRQKLAMTVAFKNILGEDYESVREKILNNYSDFSEFIEASREDKEIFPKYLSDKYIEQMKRVLDKKQKQVEVEYLVSVKCLESDGVKKIKDIFEFKDEKIKVNYLSAGNFSLKYLTDGFKSGKQEMGVILEGMREKAKEYNCEFEYREERH